MSNFKKLAFFLAPLALFTLLPMLASAQDAGSKTMTVTGCMKQGSDANGYYLMGQDGKMYELWGKNLGEHMGHTVTVTGTQTKLSSAMEQKKEATEKTEAGSAPVMDLKVSSLKMVSETCK
ncbi:MAG TPA: hypothetical protein VGG15_09700 [Terriglobales bacterium]|jgi:hypothetical protein